MSPPRKVVLFCLQRFQRLFFSVCRGCSIVSNTDFQLVTPEPTFYDRNFTLRYNIVSPRTTDGKKTHREYQVAYVCYQALPSVNIHHCRVSSTPRDVPEHLDKCNFGTNPAQDRASVCSQNCFENFIFYFFTTA